MYTIKQEFWGYRLTFGGYIKADEMQEWRAASERLLAGAAGPFGVFVDMRSLKPLPADAQAVMEQGQRLYKDAGMERSVVVLDNPVTTMQFKRIAQQSGIYRWERYLDASAGAGWEAVGLAWLTRGIDPDVATGSSAGTRAG